MTEERQHQSDLERRIHNASSYGTIAEVDHAKGLVRVDIAGRQTDWLPAPAAIGQNFRAFTPTRVGAQVLVSCPSGDPANDVISQILYSEALPPPDDTGDVDVILWNDGSRVSYDSASQVMTLHSVGTLRLKGDQGVFIDGAFVKVFDEG